MEPGPLLPVEDAHHDDDTPEWIGWREDQAVFVEHFAWYDICFDGAGPGNHKLHRACCVLNYKNAFCQDAFRVLGPLL